MENSAGIDWGPSGSEKDHASERGIITDFENEPLPEFRGYARPADDCEGFGGGMWKLQRLCRLVGSWEALRMEQCGIRFVPSQIARRHDDSQ